MRSRLGALALAAIVLGGCWQEREDKQAQTVVEQAAEIERLTERLDRADRFINALKREGGVIIKYQTLTQAAKFQSGSGTLDAVRDRKKLLCGGNADLPGFGYLDPDSGEFTGFDIDICRAISAAVLGTDGAELLEIVPLTARLRFASLQAGEIDVLSRNSTWTLTRDTELRIDFAGVSFYDGQGVLVRNEDEFLKLSDLAGGSVCVQSDSTSAANIQEYFETRGHPIEIRAFEERTTAIEQYDNGACDAYTGDKSSLASQKSLLKQPAKHQILVDEISREPLSLAVRHDDDNWADIVHWSLQCLLAAEALGVNQENVQTMLSSTDNAVRALLGVEGKLGAKLGLSNDFCYQAILQVGSYDDIYRRHLGTRSPFNLPRGLNALYQDGGLHYPLPFK